MGEQWIKTQKTASLHKMHAKPFFGCFPTMYINLMLEISLGNKSK